MNQTKRPRFSSLFIMKLSSEIGRYPEIDSVQVCLGIGVMIVSLIKHSFLTSNSRSMVRYLFLVQVYCSFEVEVYVCDCNLLSIENVIGTLPLFEKENDSLADWYSSFKFYKMNSVVSEKMKKGAFG